MGYVQKKYSEFKRKQKEAKVHSDVRKDMARKAYLAEREKQAVKTAVHRARTEGESLRKSGGGTSWGSAFGGLQNYATGFAQRQKKGGSLVAPSGLVSGGYGGGYNTSSPKKARRKKRSHKRKKSRGKTVTIRLG